jgi:hypothetical protein
MARLTWALLATLVVGNLGGIHPSDRERDTSLIVGTVLVMLLNLPMTIWLGRRVLFRPGCEVAKASASPFVRLAATILVESMSRLGDSLPLLSPAALRHYLPRYLEFSLTDHRSILRELVLYHLAPEAPEEPCWRERYSVFSDAERQAIHAYFIHRRDWEEAWVAEEWLKRALAFWGAGR